MNIVLPPSFIVAVVFYHFVYCRVCIKCPWVEAISILPNRRLGTEIRTICMHEVVPPTTLRDYSASVPFEEVDTEEGVGASHVVGA